MEETTMQPTSSRRKTVALLVFAAIILIGLVAVLVYLQYKSTHISTDDAFIDGRVYTIAAKISGTVTRIHVDDNQFVRKGDLILELDAADYAARMREAESGLYTERSRLTEAEAKVETAKKQLTELKYRFDAAKATLELQEANLRQADIDMKRAETLFNKEAISRERYEKTMTGYDVAHAAAKAARDQMKQAETAIETQKAVIRQTESSIKPQESSIKKSEAVLTSAALTMGYTMLYAPTDGYITKKSVQPGNQLQPGQPLMAVVPLDDIWVVANYKENQLEKVRAGQTVEILVDTYPGKRIKGKVDSIMAGTGAAFSLFPPENATGNFVKVVQRIPVKIVFEKYADPKHVLRVGMSVEPTILIE